MNSAEWIVRHIGSALWCVPLAAAAAWSVSLIWPLMTVPVFVATTAWWILGGLSLILREQREGVLDYRPSRSEIRRRTRVWPMNRSERWEYTINKVAALLLMFVVGTMIGGLAHLVLHSGEWLALLTVVGLWFISVIKMISKDYVERDSG